MRYNFECFIHLILVWSHLASEKAVAREPDGDRASEQTDPGESSPHIVPLQCMLIMCIIHDRGTRPGRDRTL
jgi:hypothetical protein